MKRIYLIGAILILLVIATVDYYYVSNNKSAPFIKNAVAADKLPADNFPPPVTNNSPANPVVQESVVQEPIVTGRHTERTFTGWNGHKKNNKRNKHSRKQCYVPCPPNNANNAQTNVSRDPNANKINLYATITPDGRSVAISGDYYGKIPRANNTVAVRKRHPVSLVGRTVQWGPEIGFNQNGFYNNNTSNMGTGYMHAGIIVNVRMGDHVALQPVLRYINKGNRVMSTLDVNTKEKLALHYLSLPVDLVYKFGSVENARVMIGAGPYISYLLGMHHVYSNTGDGSFMDVVGPPAPAYNEDNIEKTDWGINGFVGIESPEGIYAKAGAEYGLKDIVHDPVTGANSNRNYSFLFSVGYIIGGYRR